MGLLVLGIEGSMYIHNTGTSRNVPGIPGYLVFRDLWASTVLGLPKMFLGCPQNPGILSIQGSMGVHGAGTSRDVPGLSPESWDT